MMMTIGSDSIQFAARAGAVGIHGDYALEAPTDSLIIFKPPSGWNLSSCHQSCQHELRANYPNVSHNDKRRKKAHLQHVTKVVV